MVIQGIDQREGLFSRFCIPAFIGFVLCLIPGIARAQAIFDPNILPYIPPNEQPFYFEKVNWHVFGRVTDVRGDPIHDAIVRVGVKSAGVEQRTLRTNLQGEFSTEYSLERNAFTNLNVQVVASLAGYLPATELVGYEMDQKMPALHLVLRNENGNPDQLSMEALIGALAPRLRDEAAKQSDVDPDRKEFVQGCEELINLGNSVAAVPRLTKVVGRSPKCVECRLLLALALLDAGSWAGGNRQLEEAAKLNEAAGMKRSEPAFIAGVLSAWRADNGGAAGSFQEALEIEPGNALALQELGRTLATQKNWEAADQYLADALRAGAGDVSRLLRVRALLELGDIAEASREMDEYVGNRNPRNLPEEARTLYLQVQDRLRLTTFAKVKSVISRSPEFLMEAMPELEGLDVAADQDPLPEILEKTGKGVASFFRNFPNTMSVEEVHQERLSKEGKVRDSLDQEFQYLLLARAEKLGLGIDEHRSTPRGDVAAFGGLDRGFMLTMGFSSVSLLFHPEYQDGATFRYLGRQSLNGTNCYVVAFAQKPETARMMGSFRTNNASAITLVQGLAWIDPTTFQISRLRTDLLAPQSKVRLQRQTTEIQFKEVAFKNIAAAYWLPQDVTVTVDWKGKVYRNLHHYSDFKLFNVESETKEKREVPHVPEAQSQAK